MKEVENVGKKILLVNPIAGGRNKDGLRKKVQDFASGRKDIEIHFSRERGYIKKVVLENIEKNSGTVFMICGGDGTVQEAASALRGSQNAMMIIPCGSCDGFATNAGFKTMPIESILSASHGKRLEADCYVINGETGVNMCGFGFDAEIAHLFALNKGRGLAGYVKLITGRLLSSEERMYTVKTENQQFEIKTWILGVANGAVMGNGAVVSPESKIDDGTLELYSIGKPKWYQVIPTVIRLFRGTLRASNLFQSWKGKKFTILSPSEEAHLDGEPIKGKEGRFTIEICEQALTLLIPNQHEKEQG